MNLAFDRCWQWALVGIVLGGCRGGPELLSVRAVKTHKDVVHVHVEIGERLAPLAYRELTDAQIETIARSAAEFRVPIYEVRCSYYTHAGLVASVVYRRREDDGSLQHEHTLIHDGASRSPDRLLSRR